MGAINHAVFDRADIVFYWSVPWATSLVDDLQALNIYDSWNYLFNMWITVSIHKIWVCPWIRIFSGWRSTPLFDNFSPSIVLYSKAYFNVSWTEFNLFLFENIRPTLRNPLDECFLFLIQQPFSICKSKDQGRVAFAKNPAWRGSIQRVCRIDIESVEVEVTLMEGAVMDMHSQYRAV